MKKFIVVIVILFSLPIFAAQRHVYESDSARGIQDSINVSNAYDTVFVHTGTYFVRDVDSLGITMKDSIILLGSSPDSVILSGLSSAGTDTAYHVIYCDFGDSSSHAAIIQGFTITKGYARGAFPHNYGNGVHCYNSSPVIKNNVIKHNPETPQYNYQNLGGGGIYCYHSASLIENNIFRENKLDCLAGAGGIIYCLESSLVIRKNSVIDNVSSHGGITSKASVLLVDSNIIENNRAGYFGGGIYCDSCLLTITNNIIRENDSYRGGGIYSSNSSGIIRDNKIMVNKTRGAFPEMPSGGGIWCSNSPVLIENNIIDSNGNGWFGGGIFGDSNVVIRNNTIVNNFALFGGGVLCPGGIVSKSLIANNCGLAGGAIAMFPSYPEIRVDSCFIVDNGIDLQIDTFSAGLAYIGIFNDTTPCYDTLLIISNSNLYYNTFQPDTEIINNTLCNLTLQNNFWWFTDSSAISSLIEGPNDHSNWKTDFIPGVPGEPISINSVSNYDSNYSFTVDSIENDPDTLYLRVSGNDRNAGLREAAVVILKSRVYPTGIAVALIETDTNSGTYEGKVPLKASKGNDTIRLDDSYNIIKADSAGDFITITANMDTSKKFVVVYRGGYGIEESYPVEINYNLVLSKNLISKSTTIFYQLPVKTKVKLSVYDLSGRAVKTLINSEKSAGYYSVNLDAKGLTNGIYFVGFETKDYKDTKKFIIMK